MVEIWRWPKASLSASLTACMETPSRPAISRSTLTIARRPPSWASLTTSRSTGEPRSLSVSLADQVATSLASLPTSVYWYCARLARVLIWMSCTGWKYSVTPGIAGNAGLQALDDLGDGGAARIARLQHDLQVAGRWVSG